MQTVNEIYNSLFEGKRVQIVAQCSFDPDIVKLINHLNVMKSKTKTLMKALDLNWDNKVISTTPALRDVQVGEIVTIHLTTPKPRKTYGTFTIENAQQQNS